MEHGPGARTANHELRSIKKKKESDIPSPVWPYGVAKRAVYFEGAGNISADYSRYGSATSVTADDVW